MKGKKEIMIIGSEGSMGKRYQAILKYLDHGFAAVDKDKTVSQMLEIAQDPLIGSFIVATPTDTHAMIVEALMPLQKPILCEKPLSRSVKNVRYLYDLSKQWGTKLTMMAQYKFAVELGSNTQGDSWYNYFRHGNDGIYWDCMQVIGMAKGFPVLGEDSPIWSCCINGRPLNLGTMDQAYVEFVKQWIDGTLEQTPEEVIAMHEKVQAMIDERKS